MPEHAKPQSKTRDHVLLCTWIFAALIVLVTIFIRIRLLGTPLERDEGEFACMGAMMLDGIPPYKLAYNMKLPGIYAIYAVIMAVFGRTVEGIHIGLLLANVATAVTLFFLARRLWNTQLALIAAASYPMLTLSVGACGTSAHATQFQMPMVLGAVILLLKAIESDRRGQLFASGLLMGLAFVTKQQAMVFAAFGGCWLMWEMVRAKSLTQRAMAARIAVYVAGALAPFVVVCIVMAAVGVFDRFWFWTFTYASRYVVETPLSTGLVRVAKTTWWFVSYTIPLIALAVVGLIGTIWDARLRKRAVFVISFFLFSFAAVSLGLYFRGHYYVQAMPAVALMIGLSVAWMSRLRLSAVLRFVPLLIFLGAVGHALWHNRTLFFAPTTLVASRLMYGAAPFPESIEVARYLREHTRPGDRIAVVGSEPQIYFYADRLPATGYLYVYGLTETHPFARKMQEEMIREIEAAKPKYIVYANVPTSWRFKAGSDRSILYWLAEYAAKHYKVTGLADIISNERTEYTWGELAAYLAPDAIPSLVVFERISTPSEE